MSFEISELLPVLFVFFSLKTQIVNKILIHLVSLCKKCNMECEENTGKMSSWQLFVMGIGPDQQKGFGVFLLLRSLLKITQNRSCSHFWVDSRCTCATIGKPKNAVPVFSNSNLCCSPLIFSRETVKVNTKPDHNNVTLDCILQTKVITLNPLASSSVLLRQ